MATIRALVESLALSRKAVREERRENSATSPEKSEGQARRCRPSTRDPSHHQARRKEELPKRHNESSRMQVSFPKIAVAFTLLLYVTIHGSISADAATQLHKQTVSALSSLSRWTFSSR